MNPAFILAMTARGPRAPTKKSSNPTPPPPSRKPRKRVRASELTRKYRANFRDSDEAMLVGDHHPLPGQRVSEISRTKGHEPDSNFVLPENRPGHTPIRFSRFPSSWRETVTGATSSASSAIIEGHDRIRIDIKKPHLIADGHAHPYVDTNDSHKRDVSLLVESANSLVAKLVLPAHRQDPHNPYRILLTPTRAALFFNNVQDAEVGTNSIDPKLEHLIDVFVLGSFNPYDVEANIFIVIAPSNRIGNPEHIEALEMVHYSKWSSEKIVVMLNADMVALTRFSSFGDEPRQPCFLKDYVPSYYIDPVAFPSKLATGAILRCFPRKWELYLRKPDCDMGYRFVAEQVSPPSLEKIRCEFSWRIAKELEAKN